MLPTKLETKKVKMKSMHAMKAYGEVEVYIRSFLTKGARWR
jgi:hypothetical protein